MGFKGVTLLIIYFLIIFAVGLELYADIEISELSVAAYLFTLAKWHHFMQQRSDSF